MNLFRAKSGMPRLLFALALCVLFVAAEPAEGQGMRGRRGKKGPKTKRKSDAARRDTSSSAADQPGVHKGRIVKFRPATDEADGDLIGTLKVKPLAKNARMLTLRVRRGEDVRIAVAGHVFDTELYPDILWKGLYCSADWVFEEVESEKKKPTVKELRALTFDTVQVEGKIEAIEGDLVLLKVRPANDRQWPDIEAKLANEPDKKKPKRIPRRKLKLKILDDVTSYVDAASQTLDLGDFETDQEIQAVVVYGKKEGILVELRSLTAEERDEEEVGPKKRGGTSGPRTRGRGSGGPKVRGRGAVRR